MADAISAKTAWALAKAIKGGSKRKGPTNGTATVVRVDQDGTHWVRISGSDVETPVNGAITVDAKAGDTVQYHLEDTRISITGNATSPSVGGTYVSQAMAPVERKANTALAEASRAKEAADTAESEAYRAHVAADAAQTSANEAAASASTASTAAQSALLGLSTVEDVVDVLAWLSAHSKATTDTSMAEGKAYYVRDATTGGMTSVKSAVNPSALGWVEAAESEDTEAVDGKTYYELNAGTGTLTPVANVPEGANPSALGWLEVAATTDTSMTGGKTYYTVDSGTGVASPLDPSALGWWEMDDAVTQYLAAHLAMTDYGLNLKVDNAGGWMRIGTLEGSNEYGTYILDEHGMSLARLGEHTRIGRDDSLHVDITDGSETTATVKRLFSIANVGDPPVMYVEVNTETKESTVYMTNAVVVQNLRFGSWMWYERPNGNMSVRWTGDDA